MNCSVASVTVAYNSAGVLPRQMDALRRQIRPLDEIIVVDSVSSDGTRELLAERYPEVKVISIPENIGAAAAVGTGIEYAALKRKHDWVWMFDDDSVPQDDALEALLNGIRTKAGDDERIGMAASLPVHLKTGMCYEPLFWRDGFVRASADLLREPVFFRTSSSLPAVWCGVRLSRGSGYRGQIFSWTSWTSNTALESELVAIGLPLSPLRGSPMRSAIPARFACLGGFGDGRSTRRGGNTT